MRLLTILLFIAGLAFAQTPTIDSVWFWADDAEVIHICYRLSGEQTAINAKATMDGGATWVEEGESWFLTFDERIGDIGFDISPGEHCFEWRIKKDTTFTDVSNLGFIIEAYSIIDTFVIIDSVDISERPYYGWGLGYGDGYYWIFNRANGFVYKTNCVDFAICPPIDSFQLDIENVNCDIDYDRGWIYYSTNENTYISDDTLKRYNVYTDEAEILYFYSSPVETVSFAGVQVIGDFLYAYFNSYDTTLVTGQSLIMFNLNNTFPVNEFDIAMVYPGGLCGTQEGLCYAFGHLWGSNNYERIIRTNVTDYSIDGCYHVPNMAAGAEGLCWDGEFIWYHNYALQQIYKIRIVDSLFNADTVLLALDYSEFDSIQCDVHPNPFTPNNDYSNDEAIFEFPGKWKENTEILIYDMKNRHVATVKERKYRWNGEDDGGNPMPKGVYIYVVKQGSEIICDGTVYIAR